MRARCLIVFLILCCTAPVMAADAGGLRRMATRHGVVHEILDNGLHLILKEAHGAPVVTIQGVVRFGSIHEEQVLGAGLAHYIEHMLFKGTPTRGLGAFDRDIRGAGGSLNAYTSYHRTVLHVTVAGSHFDVALDALADVMRNSLLDEAEARKEKEVIVKEIEKNLDDPGRTLGYLFNGALFTAHPRGHPIAGYLPRFLEITHDDLLRAYRRFYVPNNCAIVIVGDFSINEKLPLVRRTFASWPRGAQPAPRVPAEPWPTGVRDVSAQHPKAKMTRVRVGWPTVTLRDDAMYPLDVLASILGRGRTSRLHRRLVIDERLAQYVECWNWTPADHWGYFAVSAGLFKPEDRARALAIIDDEMTRIVREGVLWEEVKRAIKKVEARTIFEQSTVEGVAGSLGSGWLTGDVHFDRYYLEQIRKVLPWQIRDAAERWLKASPRVIATLYPAEPKQAAKPSPQQAATRALDIRRFTLDNGLRLLVKRNAGLPEAELRLAFLAGTRFEPEDKAGISDFMAKLLDKGTTKRSAEQIFAAIENVGGSIGAEGGRHTVTLRARVLAADLPLALELLADMARTPRFAPEWIERIRQRTLQSIENRNERAWTVNWDNLRQNLYAGHPYARHPLGTPETVRAITRDDLVALHRALIAPENGVLTIVGDVDPDAARRQVQKAFGARAGANEWVTGRARLPAAPRLVPPTGPSEIIKFRDGMHLAEMALGFQTVPMNDPDKYVFDVIQAILGGMGSRLFVDLRDERSLAYMVGCFHHEGIDGSGFVFYISSSPHKSGALSTYDAVLGAARERFVYHVEKLRTEPLTADELAFAKRNLAGRKQIGLQSNGSQAQAIVLDTLYGFDPDRAFRYAERIGKVTVKDVTRVARRYLDMNKVSAAILRPKE